MSQAFIGQVQPMAFNFAPKFWAQCNGQIMSIQQNAALFALLGTMYGGNGSTTFGLPSLQSRVPMHVGTLNSEVFVQGEMAGVENVFLTSATTPQHNHAFNGASSNGNSTAVTGGVALATAYKASGTPDMFYGPDTTAQPLNVLSIGMTGGGLPHNNLQPYLTLNWCICTSGVFPSRG
jgi:microcystin-dependent protein